MKAVVPVFELILIFIALISLLAVSTPWLYQYIQTSMEIAESRTVKQQFDLCSDKLVETAQTGSSNNCFFDANRGTLTAYRDGIYYKIISKGEICTPHDWVEINTEKHIWQKCDVSGDIKIYQLKWSWPSELNITGYSLHGNITRIDTKVADINFEEPAKFITITVYVEFEYREGQEGKILQINRLSITQDKVMLNVNIK